MENKVLFYRNKLHLTQTELAEKSGLSLRTVQRIESGNEPKGFTLKALANALEINIADLTEEEKSAESENNINAELQTLRLINISALAFLAVPFSNIILPCILIYRNKNVAIRKSGFKILYVQIIWGVITSLLLIVSPFVQHLLKTKVPIILIVAFIMALINIGIILSKTVELNRKIDLS